VPIPFESLVDESTGRARVRFVDNRSARYGIARRYMIRLRRDDFEDGATIADCAKACGLAADDFRSQFAYLVEDEPPAVILEDAESSI
jgi:6-phosphofructokinase 1